jgi:hypothetical protein
LTIIVIAVQLAGVLCARAVFNTEDKEPEASTPCSPSATPDSLHPIHSPSHRLQ